MVTVSVSKSAEVLYVSSLRPCPKSRLREAIEFVPCNIRGKRERMKKHSARWYCLRI